MFKKKTGHPAFFIDNNLWNCRLNPFYLLRQTFRRESESDIDEKHDTDDGADHDSVLFEMFDDRVVSGAEIITDNKEK